MIGTTSVSEIGEQALVRTSDASPTGGGVSDHALRLLGEVGDGGGPGAGDAPTKSFSFAASPPLGRPIAQILSPWLDNHVFVAAGLIAAAVILAPSVTIRRPG